MTRQLATDFDMLEDAVRERLANSSETLLEVSLNSGISKTHLTNFKNRKRKLSFQNLDQLARYFGVRYSLKNF